MGKKILFMACIFRKPLENSLKAKFPNFRAKVGLARTCLSKVIVDLGHEQGGCLSDRLSKHMKSDFDSLF